jgi:4-hydroxy-tetrahydrodipicolinate reductase
MTNLAESKGGPLLPPLAIIGAGRMGRAVDALATERGWQVRARITSQESVTTHSLAGAAVAVEFTTGRAAPTIIRACAAARCVVVSGTTGWDEEMPAVEAEVVRTGGALLWAPNFAIGAHLLAAAGVQVGRAIRDQQTYSAALIETHHVRKRDAPSGTALTIARAVGAAWGRQVPITSVRLGDVPGDHELIIDGPFEQIRLVHSVRDRRVFAEGALAAAAWLVGRSGVFSMENVLQSPMDGRPAEPRDADEPTPANSL